MGMAWKVKQVVRRYVPQSTRFRVATVVRTTIATVVPRSVRVSVRDGRQRRMLAAGKGELVPAQEFEEFVRKHLPRCAEGSYAEFGVCYGTSMISAVRAFDACGRSASRFVGFDSFQGLPPGSERDGWRTGSFETSRAVAEWNLQRSGIVDRVSLIEGWFNVTCNKETAREVQLNPVAVAMIDADTYSSSKTAMDFVASYLTSPAMLSFDDWYSLNPDGTKLEGQRLVYDEYLTTTGAIGEDLGRVGFSGQAFLVTATGTPNAGDDRS